MSSPAPPPARSRQSSFDPTWVTSLGTAPKARARKRSLPAIRRPLFFRLIEVAQVGRLLALLGRHQHALTALEIHIVADEHQSAALHAHVLGPDRELGAVAPVFLRH